MIVGGEKHHAGPVPAKRFGRLAKPLPIHPCLFHESRVAQDDLFAVNGPFDTDAGRGLELLSRCKSESSRFGFSDDCMG